MKKRLIAEARPRSKVAYHVSISRTRMEANRTSPAAGGFRGGFVVLDGEAAFERTAAPVEGRIALGDLGQGALRLLGVAVEGRSIRDFWPQWPPDKVRA